ncbi:hypothetical protein LTR56_002285 [Elasticomyces elasticus]|nr:hypothetical protein LTR56_002285 [Elasticomyces elasticus]KAK3665850.1 hypothetical protein LTR22_003168 [Elasticomyces elasticus]KAK4929322.1 hypothetical protein LTR49_003925 [Elasticomyces elasticus]KAK5741689.1 hypothetical protein LTS12_024531 [Elasticomyces elasticus]
MADLSIAASHAAGTKWAAAWSQTSPQIWTSLYTPSATYTDYAFGFIRRGHAGLKSHFEIWRTAHPDFLMTVTEAWPGIDLGDGLVKYSIRTSNQGTFTNDLPTLKASGKKFDFYAVVDLVVRSEDGLVVKVEEWYHRQIDYEKLLERDAPVASSSL